MEEQLREWMIEHDDESVDQMHGAFRSETAADPATFERANYIGNLASYTSRHFGGHTIGLRSDCGPPVCLQVAIMWWLAHGQSDTPTTYERLSAHERSHLDSVRYTKRRDEYITRRWTAKQAIATVLDIGRTPDELTRIEIRHRESGAPCVQLDGTMLDVDVSMTGRSGWAVGVVGPLGVTTPGTVGIDLEVVEPRSALFVADYFTAAERAFVARLPAERFDETANLIWSAKEAAVKVQQVGLRVDTRTVDVDLHGDTEVDGWVAMTVSGVDGPMPGWWRRSGVFVLTIAYSEPTAPPQLIPTGSSLDTAQPQHSWVRSPTC
jgi:4'-phosphopantetheinyl transferase